MLKIQRNPNPMMSTVSRSVSLLMMNAPKDINSIKDILSHPMDPMNMVGDEMSPPTQDTELVKPIPY